MVKITIIGAGSIGFTKSILCELALSEELGDMTVSLMDIDAERLNNTRLLAQKIFRQAKREVRIEASMDRREALAGADYVVNVTMIGGLTCRRIDCEVPLKYGVKQAVGCTMGPGGVMSALRSIPFLLEVAAEMAELCPNAVMLNYHNPQSATAQVWDRVSRVKYVGLCHGVSVTCGQLASYIGCDDTRALDFLVAGINHMAWVLRFQWNGRDAYPILRERMEDPQIYWQDNVRFEMFRHFGYFSTESTNHMSEYVPYFRRTDAMIERNRLPVQWYVRYLEAALANHADQVKVDLDPDREIDLRRSNEATTGIIRALETGETYRFPVNVVNRGLIENLPAEAAVEVPATFDRSGVHPQPIGRLPTQLAALNQTNLNVQQMMAQAVLEKSKELAVQAVMLDPLTASLVELAEIRTMMAELFSAEARWLPEWVTGPQRTAP